MIGKPLYRWILDELAGLSFLSEIIINTDAGGLLQNSDLPGGTPIRIRNRATDLLGDDVSMNSIIRDDLNNSSADAYLMTHSTNPLITSETFVTAFQTYRKGLENGKDSLFSVNRFQNRLYRSDGSPVNHDPEQLIPTQDLEPWFEENSCLYFFSKTSFETTGSRIGSSPILYETPPLESIDIDEPQDWELAEVLLNRRICR